MQLQQFSGYQLVSVEKDMRNDKAAADLTSLGVCDSVLIARRSSCFKLVLQVMIV